MTTAELIPSKKNLKPQMLTREHFKICAPGQLRKAQP